MDTFILVQQSQHTVSGYIINVFSAQRSLGLKCRGQITSHLIDFIFRVQGAIESF
jgi:hypothetical protein